MINGVTYFSKRNDSNKFSLTTTTTTTTTTTRRQYISYKLDMLELEQSLWTR